MNLKKYIKELKRRNVFKAAIAYLVVAWICIQVSNIVLFAFEAPDFVIKVIIFLISLGFPFWLIFSWIYEITPNGLKKTEEVDETNSISYQTGNRLNKVILVLLFITILLVFFDGFWYSQKTHTNKTNGTKTAKSISETKKSIAVLSFLNYSKNETDDYLAEGITEAITLELSKNDDLRVVSRTSAMSYKTKVKLSSEIANELEADYLIEGSVLYSADSIRVTVQLVEVFPKEKNIWVNSYYQKVENTLQLIENISLDIANKINRIVTLNTITNNSYKVDPKAYDLYLRGRYLWNQQSDESINSAIDFLKESIKIDSSFAPAYVALAESYITLNKFINNNEEKPHNREKSKNAINKALKFDANLGAAYISKGNILGKCEWNWEGMKIMLDKGLKLDPNNAYGHMLLSDYYLVNSNFDMAINEALIAEKLDPLNPMIATMVGEKICFSGNYEKSIEQFQKVLKIFPSYGNAWNELGLIQYIIGQKNDSKNSFIKLQEIQGNYDLVRAYKEKPIEDVFISWLSRLKSGDSSLSSFPILTAQIHMLLNEKQEAMDYLEIAFESQNEYLPLSLFRPEFNNLHNEPRFKKIVQKVGVNLKI